MCVSMCLHLWVCINGPGSIGVCMLYVWLCGCFYALVFEEGGGRRKGVMGSCFAVSCRISNIDVC